MRLRSRLLAVRTGRRLRPAGGAGNRTNAGGAGIRTNAAARPMLEISSATCATTKTFTSRIKATWWAPPVRHRLQLSQNATDAAPGLDVAGRAAPAGWNTLRRTSSPSMILAIAADRSTHTTRALSGSRRLMAADSAS